MRITAAAKSPPRKWLPKCALQSALAAAKEEPPPVDRQFSAVSLGRSWAKVQWQVTAV